MKKLLSAVMAVALVIGALAVNVNQPVKAQSSEYVVTNYQELKNAMALASSSNEVVITIANDVAVQSSIEVNGNVVIKANNKEKLIFDYNNKKTSFTFAKNTNLTLDNITVYREVADETETFVFSSYSKQVTINFNNCVFDVATAEIASINYDRIVYCSSDVSSTFTCYLNGCTFNTEGYFYRGTFVVFNCDELPTKGSGAVIHDFSALKIDYVQGKLTFPSDITVSEDESFTKNVKSGTSIKSEFTYYALKNGFSFSFTTLNLKHETPTQASVSIDYASETISFESDYAVYSNSSLTNVIESGAKVEPGQTIYIVQKGSGIFIDSDAFEYTLPQRPAKRELNADFVCSFGFAMEHVNNCEYRVNGGEWQKAPVFVGLQANTEYTVDMRIASTVTSFVSEIYTVKVTTSE